jgi:hypothetical protein
MHPPKELIPKNVKPADGGVRQAAVDGVPSLAAQQKRRLINLLAPLDHSAVDHPFTRLAQLGDDLIAAPNRPEVIDHERISASG